MLAESGLQRGWSVDVWQYDSSCWWVLSHDHLRRVWIVVHFVMPALFILCYIDHITAHIHCIACRTSSKSSYTKALSTALPLFYQRRPYCHTRLLATTIDPLISSPLLLLPFPVSLFRDEWNGWSAGQALPGH